jgi:hypothetical protein
MFFIHNFQEKDLENMKTNVATKTSKITTHEGATAVRINAEKQLLRSVMACLLWESQFYENGVDISTRIAELVPQVEPAKVALMAIEAREQMKLRHAPLFVVREMARAGTGKGSVAYGFRAHTAETLARVIQRADELAEFLAMYWKDGKVPISHSVRQGLDKAIRKFDEYSLSKYDRAGAVKLRDVFRLVHPKPDNAEQSALWKRAVKGELATPDTWEVELSRNDGVDKKDKWTRLLVEKKLGALALLRNLRNMEQAGVDRNRIGISIAEMSTYRVLPFRFIAAERHAPHLSGALEEKFFQVAGETKLPGRTVILVDISGSMHAPLSAKSDMERIDAACGVAMVGREMFDDVEIYTFANDLVAVPNRRGFALRDAIRANPGGGTYLGKAVAGVDGRYDRLIVITDEQSHDRVPDPTGKGYMINVASYQNGVGYGKWVHLDGWSESVFRYIVALESEQL